MPPDLVEDLLACLAPGDSVDPPCPDLRELTLDVHHHGSLPVNTLVEFFLNEYGSDGTESQHPHTSNLRCIQIVGDPGWSEVERRPLDRTLETLETPLPEIEVSNVGCLKDNLIQSKPALTLQPSEDLN